MENYDHDDDYDILSAWLVRHLPSGALNRHHTNGMPPIIFAAQNRMKHTLLEFLKRESEIDFLVQAVKINQTNRAGQVCQVMNPNALIDPKTVFEAKTAFDYIDRRWGNNNAKLANKVHSIISSRINDQKFIGECIFSAFELRQTLLYSTVVVISEATKNSSKANKVHKVAHKTQKPRGLYKAYSIPIDVINLIVGFVQVTTAKIQNPVFDCTDNSSDSDGY